MGGRKGKSMRERGERSSHGRGVVDGNKGCVCCIGGGAMGGEGTQREGDERSGHAA